MKRLKFMERCDAWNIIRVSWTFKTIPNNS